MSDDEYYDSPYDEFEEMLWDADPAPHLADDLAQHAAYSPVWQDDPVGELDAYHSDWEYYSDDYFDDDPAILHVNPVDGVLPQGGSKKDIRSTRGRKRKIDEVTDATEGPEAKALRGALRGTVWAETSAPTTKVFHHGRQEKVALLVDWRERFQLGPSKHHSPNRGLKRDESWANDLSLGDMGLKGIRERPGAQENIVIEEDDTLTGTEELTGRPPPINLPMSGRTEGDGEDEADNEYLEESETAMHEIDNTTVDSQAEMDHKTKSNNITSDLDNQSDESIDGLPKSGSRKSNRKSLTSFKLRKPEPGGDTEEVDQLKVSKHDMNSARRPTKATENASRHRGDVAFEESGNEVADSQSNSISQRKRRLSSTPEESPKATGSTTSSRAKRVASRRLGSGQKDDTSAKNIAANTRSTKARKS